MSKKEDELYLIYQITIDNIKYSKNQQSDTGLCFTDGVYSSLCDTILWKWSFTIYTGKTERNIQKN